MGWGNLKLWKKISLGIGSVLVLLLLISLWAIYGLTQVVHEGHEVITGNSLRSELLQREVDHLNWVKNVSVYLLDAHANELTVELDHTKCGFGKWYYGKEREQAETLIPALKEPLAAIEEPHRRLHESAASIKRVYNKASAASDGRREAETIFSTQTQPSLKTIQGLLSEMNDITRKNLLSEGGMLKHAMETRMAAIIITVLAILTGILVGWLITRSITRPLVKGVVFAQAVAAGDLAQTLEVKTKDEVGDLANALNTMVASLKEMVGRIKDSSGLVASAANQISANSEQLTKAANSQASAADETSSTMVQMAASIQTVAGNADSLAGNAEEVSSSIHELGASSEQVAKSAEVMASSVSETSATIEQMTVSIDQVAGNSQELQKVVTESASVIEQLAVSIKQVARNVEEADVVAKTAAKEGSAGLQAGQEAVGAMKKVAEVIEKTSGSILNLGRRSEEIGNIVKVINEIADQTNLLALNAAIEAARAGDAGRGFAVVAEEVRKLAERSMAATKEIAQVIRQVQSDTEESVRYGEIAAKEAQASMEMSSLAGGALENIVKSIERTSNLMSDIARMTAEQANASTQVIRAVEKMSQATDVVANAAREQAVGGRQIRIAVERMNHITQEVTGATREQAQGSRQIRIAVENMNHITGQVTIATREQSLSARQIVEAVNAMNLMTQSVANATSEQKKGGEMVVSAMENISDTTRENLSSVEQLSRAAQGLSQQAIDLSGLVAQFRVN